MAKEKKNLSVVIICIVLCLLCLAGGVMIGKILFSNLAVIEEKENKEKEDKEKEDKEKVPEIEDNLPTELSSDMISFLKWTYLDQNENILENIARRKQFINMSLGSVAKTTTEPSQQVSYVDYETYKNKYEEVYGDNYNFEEDYNITSSGGPDPDSCKFYPSAGEDGVCWSNNYGVSAGTFEYTLTNTHQDGNQYYMEGTFTVTYPDGVGNNGTFEIMYIIEDHQAYLKSISQKID